jgi:hypothetical protein
MVILIQNIVLTKDQGPAAERFKTRPQFNIVYQYNIFLLV